MSDASSPPQLSGRDRRALRRQAHALRPVVQVGAAGLADGVLAAVDTALRDHELIKLEIAHERGERERVADEVAARTGSALAGMVGHMAILYRPAADPQQRRIQLATAAGDER
jgi:RNA-binding protein